MSEHKLIHLSASDETTTDYECVFNEDILVKRNAQIALQSLSMNFNPDQLFIDASNNRFFLSQGGAVGFGATNAQGDATSLQGTLTSGSYNQLSLMRELQYKLNSTNTQIVDIPAGNTPKTGPKYEYVVLTDSKQRLQINLSAVADDSSGTTATDWITSSNNITVSGDPASFQKVGGNNVNDYVVYKPIFIRSRGQIRATFNNSQPDTIIGLLNSFPDPATTATIGSQGYYYGIMRNDSNEYIVIQDGVRVSVVPGIVPANGHRVIIGIAQSNLYIKISVDGGNNWTQVNAYPFSRDTQQEYMHFACTLNRQAAIVNNWQFTPSPYQLSTTDGIHLTNDITELNNINYISNIGALPPGAPPIITLTMQAGLRDLLGFANLTNTVRSYNTSIVGQNAFQSIVFPNALYIELLNVSLESYDSISRRRKNVISYLTGLQNTGNTDNYYYSAPELIYINTRLAADTLINSWQVRITDDSGTPIVIDAGKISINLVVKQ